VLVCRGATSNFVGVRACRPSRNVKQEQKCKQNADGDIGSRALSFSDHYCLSHFLNASSPAILGRNVNNIPLYDTGLMTSLQRANLIAYRLVLFRIVRHSFVSYLFRVDTGRHWSAVSSRPVTYA